MRQTNIQSFSWLCRSVQKDAFRTTIMYSLGHGTTQGIRLSRLGTLLYQERNIYSQ
jgi:hypothetical protein